MEVWKIIFLSKWVICSFHVNLPGCSKNGDYTASLDITYLKMVTSPTGKSMDMNGYDKYKTFTCT